MTDWQVIHGDCRDVLPSMDVGSIGCVITDPPYGISLENHRGGEWNIPNDDTDIGQWFIDNYKGSMAVFSSPYRPFSGKWRNVLVWNKGPAVGGGGDIATCWKRSFEIIQIAKNGPLNGKRDEAVLNGFTVTPSDSLDHVAQKPVSLLKYLIRKLTNPGDTIFDPFCGSGSTGVASIEMGRRFIGIEIDEHWANVSRRRIEEAANNLFAVAGI